MAAINSVPKSIHIPLAGLNASRVLMCHASVGTDNSVTLKLRDTNGLSDATQLANASATQSALENVLTIDYSEADMIADVLGTLQSSSHKNNNANKLVNALNITTDTTATTATTTKCLNTTQKNENFMQSNTSAVVQVNSASCTSTAHKVVGNLISTTNSNTKTSSYIKNCLIRSSSNANNNNNNNNNNSLTTLAQIMSHSSSSSSTSTSSSNHSHSSSGCPQGNNGSTVSSSSSSTSSNNSNSSTSNFSSNSNDSISSSSNNSSNSNSIPSHQNKNPQNVPASTNPPKSVKKHRSKALSPTRHGPQQCQICNKIFGNASALAKHKLTHSDERKYVCSMCTKAFKRQDHLNGHMMTHRNKKPYECKAEGCSKSYCDARSLRRHTENHHAGLTLTSSQTQSLATNIINSNLSPTATNGEISAVDANTLRTYIANGNSLVDATTGETLTEDQIKTISLPINTTVSLLSPASSSSSHNGSMSNANCANLTVAETAFEGEGLTPKQLDLISQIMQRNKQTSAQVTVSSPTSVNSYKIATANSKSELLNGQKPRTWNMQLLNQTKKISITVDEIASVELFTKHDGNTEMSEPKTEEEMNVHTGALVHPNLLKNDLKPVECNLCHRKFKNIPALNGHMRLHGGYFKKDPEAKKNEKKESNGPPLQTASIGVRALIEEKIISKRGKDLNKNAFIVPAPPGTLLNTKAPQNISFETQTVAENKTTNNGLITTTIQLPNATTIINAKQHKYSNNMRLAVGTNSPPLVSKTINYYPATTNVIGKSDETELKDSTLIELLKRGTRVAVTQRKATNNGNLILNNTDVINKNNNNSNNKSIEIPNANQILNSNNRTLIIPADIHMVTKSKNDTNTLSSASLQLADGTPLSLTISNDNDINTTEKTYSVTYADDESQFLNENSSVYNLSDSEMLVNTVEPMHFLNDTATDIKTEHSEQYTNEHNNDNCSVIVEDITDDVLETFLPKKSDTAINVCTLSPIQSPVNGYPTIQLPTQLNTNAPLPNFQQFHSKEIIMQTSAQLQALTASSRSNTLTLPSFTSPMHSPLQYPTPPSSHENVTQSSPFIEDRHANYIEGSNTNSFFGDKCDLHEFLTQTSKSTDFFKANQNDNELQKTLNETDTTFGSSIEVEDLLNGSQDAGACDLPEFSETNLSFLDDDQLFLNDTQNESSSLSKSFFTGSVDDVKRMLRDVLCEENIIMNSTEQRNENIVDLCYIAGVGMMSNSDDPLLSSSSHEFGQRLQIQDPQHNTETKANANVEEKLYMPQSGNQSLLQQQLQQQLPEQANEAQNQQFEQQEVVNQTNNAEQIVIYATNKLTKETLLQHTKQYEQQHNNGAMTKQVEDTKQTAVESTDEVDGHCSQNKITDATSMLESCLQFPTPESSIKIVSNLQPISNYTKSLLKRRYQTAEMNDSVAKKSCTQTTYHSKLRKPSRTHYTAPPMLNPDRDGLGLYSSVRRKLNGGTLPFDTFSSDDFSDHIGLAEFSDESKVNLGSDYQAQIPQLRQRRGLKFNIDVQETVPAEILWDPKAQTDEGSLKRFIELSKSSTGPLGSHTEEDALTTLLRAKGNISTAILTLLQTPSNQFTNKWSANDMEVFFRSMERFGKDFSKISTKVSTKSIGDCVQLYYFWKKLCVEQKVVNYKNTDKKDENKSNYKITTEYLKSALKQDDKLRCKLRPTTTTTITTTATATIMKSEMQSINRIMNNDVGIQNTDESTNNSFSSSSNSNNSLTEVKPFMCEMPDCSASFMSKAALHGHTRIHSTNAKNDNSNCAQHMNGHIVNSNSACTPFKLNSNLTAPMSDCASKNGTQQQHTQCVDNKEVVLSQYPCKMCGKNEQTN